MLCVRSVGNISIGGCNLQSNYDAAKTHIKNLKDYYNSIGVAHLFHWELYTWPQNVLIEQG